MTVERNDAIGTMDLATLDPRARRLIPQIRGTPHGCARFFDTVDLPWIAELESQWRDIRQELDRILPTADLLPGLEQIQVGQYTLTNDNRWKIFPFFAYGRWARRNVERCPRTADAISGIPGLVAALFSIMHARKEIPPHHGNYCGILRYHLALAIPEPSSECGICVGGETRHWSEGKSLLFDDTYLHSAWNRCSSDRVVLLADVQRPLTPALARKNREVIELIAKSESVHDSAARWDEWEAVHGDRLDRMLQAPAMP